MAPAVWPLKWLGLDPGRAQANARPDPRRHRQDRVEQFAYIAAKLAADDDQLAILARSAKGSDRDEVSIAVFDGDRLITRHAALAALLGETVPASDAPPTPVHT